MAQSESILDKVKEFNLVTEISKKTDKPYQILELKLSTGLQCRFFLDYRDQAQLVREITEINKEESKFDLNDS